jgi:hypothetical protein
MCNNYLLSPDLRSIALNIIGGALVILFGRLYLFVRKEIRAINFKKIFGTDILDRFYIIYGKMTLETVYDSTGKVVGYPQMVALLASLSPYLLLIQNLQNIFQSQLSKIPKRRHI